MSLLASCTLASCLAHHSLTASSQQIEMIRLRLLIRSDLVGALRSVRGLGWPTARAKSLALVGAWASNP